MTKPNIHDFYALGSHKLSGMQAKDVASVCPTSQPTHLKTGYTPTFKKQLDANREETSSLNSYRSSAS